ncbi:MAG: anthranilate phosphoribosyltransferase [Sphingomonadaceae bacterium]
MKALPDPSHPLDAQSAEAAFAAILGGAVADSELAAFLVALAGRGETAAEVAAAAQVMRRLMVPVTAPPGAIDVCGTGGDGSHSLNVSTAVAFVVAACGVPVAKHGNRAASSRCGTADVLEALGADLALPLDRIEACLEETGVAFLFAQRHHPALARVAGVRRALGCRTIFNLLGPLANPAGVRRQMVGVFAPRWVVPMAEAGAALGAEAMLVVHGGGLDEIAVHGPTEMAWCRHGRVMQAVFVPGDHGLAAHPLAALAGGDAAENASALGALLAGDTSGARMSAYRAIVTANAAAALKLADAAQGWPQALAMADAAIASGAAADRLARFVAFR